jgi:anti-sigma B factor antagonist
MALKRDHFTHMKGNLMPLTILTHEKQAGVILVSAFGSLDTDTHQTFEKKMDLLIGGGTAKVITLDMSGVEYISSMGVRVILKAKKDLHRRGGTFTLMNPQRQVRRVFEIINALPSLQIFASLDELDSYLSEMQRQALEERI